MFVPKILILFIISLATINAKLENDIADKHDAPDGKYPFQISIQYKNEHICSGTIIDKRHILTSSFCLSVNVPDITLIAGTNSLSTEGQKLKVMKYIQHEEISHNIALIRTTENINFNDKIKSIAITKKDYRESGYPVIFLSWNRSNSSTNNKLQVINKKLYDQDECKNIYENINEQDICTFGESGENDCDINIGSPIIADGVQIGIRTVSQCGTDVIATNIRAFYYRDWILNNINLEI